MIPAIYMNPLKRLLVSIIIPVYNVEIYLRRCIDSVLSQTYSNFELILVDDGSKDRSGQICDEYAKRDSRIRVIHKPNGGVSTARNIALQELNGEYITFIDSDDYVGIKYIQGLLDAQNDTNSDFVIEGETKVIGSNLSVFRFQKKTIRDSEISILFSDFKLQKRCSPWGKLFKRKIIEKFDIRFSENVHLGEDIIFVLKYLTHCDVVTLISASDYFYVQRQGSLTKKLNSYSSEFLGWKQYMEAKNDLIKKHKLTEDAIKELSMWSIIFLDRTKLSIIKTLEYKNALIALKNIDWLDLKKYKVYFSKKEYFWDSLLWKKCFNLFLFLFKLKTILYVINQENS